MLISLFRLGLNSFDLCLFFSHLFVIAMYNDRIQGLAFLQQPTWINQESKFERLNSGKPLW
jgi:hypothetical protein